MKKLLVLGAIWMLLISLMLTACGEQADDGSTVVETPMGDSNSPINDAMNLELSINDLLLGTLMLEDTDLAIDPEMASQLLPLWQAARAIYTSDTSAAEEREAILNQIAEVMIADRLAAIKAMDLNSETMVQTMSEWMREVYPEGFPFVDGMEGFRFEGELPEGFPDPPEGMPEGFSGFRPGQGFGGGPGLGEGSGDGFGPGMGQGLDPEAQATLQAERGSRGGRQTNPFMFEIIIEFLQERALEG
ncbi:MAG: hypothetical protein PVI78_06345 [Anaerolineales bacterium]|jgi:hypothetical protein